MFADRSSAAWGIVTSVLVVAVALGLMLLFDLDEQVRLLLAWLDARGPSAPLLFIILMAVVVVLLLPGVLFTTGAGFVFGVVEGTACVVAGTTLGAIGAFLIARHLFGERATRFVLRHGRLAFVSEGLAPHSWKIVMLTRLIPFFPFKLSNYLFGLTSFSLRGFAGGTVIGIVPFSLHNVYLGSIAADVATLGTRSADRGVLEWALYVAGFLAAAGIVLYVNGLARRELARYTSEDLQGEDKCHG